MKNIKRITITTAFIIFTAFAFAQTPPPPNNGTTGSGGSTPVGGGAPIGNDLFILITAAISYALIDQLRKKKKLENDVLKL